MAKVAKKKKIGTGINEHTRNAFETDNILKTYQSLIMQVRKGKYPIIFHHTSRGMTHLNLIEVLLASISLESHVYGMTAHFKIILPKTMRRKGKDVGTSSEKRAKIYLKEAMKVVKKLKLESKVHSDVIAFINSHMKNVTYAIQLRNKLAHGETFHTFNSSKKKKKVRMSKKVREFNESDKIEIVTSIQIFKNFTDNVFYMLPKKPSPESIRHYLVSLFYLMKRDDLLGKLGMKNVGGGVIVSSDMAKD